MHGNKGKNCRKITDYTTNDLFLGKNLDIVTAALLLTGKLKVDFVKLYRGSPAVSVELLGK
ncbi:hypothetical protein [Heliorestis acidaminivorans]|uniref:hypothetical protein n=1 Tax=Heliorestis acidaminivorans TaxID=553427 RepID=UPI001A9AADFB|nr:hypothetical protein [Heliorestis acidaminivorans]